MKIDQIAFFASTPEQADQIKGQFGLTDKEWIRDLVTARSIVRGVESINKAELLFNYTLGIELEILCYLPDENGRRHDWHQNNPLAGSAANRFYVKSPFISHVGIHLEDGEPFPKMVHCRLVQETFTVSHTSEYLTKPGSPGFGRQYHYQIFEMSPGTYIKYIRRILPKGKSDVR